MRLIFILILISQLFACASDRAGSTKTKGNLTNEQLQTAESMLINSHNYQGLAEFYKGSLKHKDTTEVRLKLAENYLVMQDPESALFYLEPLIKKRTANASVYYVTAKSYYDLKKDNQAILYAKRSLKIDGKYAKSFNLLGIIYSSSMDFKQARSYFNKARSVLFNDVKIKNNIAMLDIIEGDYPQAVMRLSALYKANPEDKKIKTNLLLALAKKVDYSSFYTLLKNQLNDSEISELYLTFNSMKLKDINKSSEEIAAEPEILNN